jgi:CRISPR-associated endonuclease/helicase Cas3
MSYSVNIGHDDNLVSLLSVNSEAVSDYGRINNASPPIYFKQSFMSAAKTFQAIDTPTRGLIVPYKKGKTIIAELCSAFDVEKQYGLLREAQRYSVNVFPHEWKKLDEEEHAIKEVQEGSGIYYLDERYYSPDFGLSLTPVNKMSFIEI